MAILEVVASAAEAQAATRSVLTCQDEDTTDTTHRTDSDGFEPSLKAKTSLKIKATRFCRRWRSCSNQCRTWGQKWTRVPRLWKPEMKQGFEVRKS